MQYCGISILTFAKRVDCRGVNTHASFFIIIVIRIDKKMEEIKKKAKEEKEQEEEEEGIRKIENSFSGWTSNTLPGQLVLSLLPLINPRFAPLLHCKARRDKKRHSWLLSWTLYKCLPSGTLPVYGDNQPLTKVTVYGIVLPPSI